jgi:hypothetical protein
MFLNTLSLCSFLHVRDQVSHPSRSAGKIIGLDMLIFLLPTHTEDYSLTCIVVLLLL